MIALLGLAFVTASAIAAPPSAPALFVRPEPAKGATITLCAVGDVMLGRHVAPVLRSRGVEAAFALVKSALACDLTVGNLESPLTERAIERGGPYRFTASPALAPALRAIGFRALSVANNHALDAGPGGLLDTISALERAGIAVVGAVREPPELQRPQLVEVSGRRVALLGIDLVVDPEDRPTDGPPRPARSLDALLDAIRRARAEDRADVVVVLAHWGREYEAKPSDTLVKEAQSMIAAGADVLFGSHPHVLGPVAPIEAGGRHGLVAWTLGNFVFDQGARPDTARSAILRVTVDARGPVRASAIPVELRRGLPVPVDGESEIGRMIEADLGAPAFATVEARALAAPRLTSAWRWDREKKATQLASPELLKSELRAIAMRTTTLHTDLRGDGRPALVELADGVVRVHDGPTASTRVAWTNEAPSWRVLRVSAGDADHDGRPELVLVLVKIGADGRATTHPFLMGVRSGRHRITWGGSATNRLIQDARLADLDGDGKDELVVLDGGPRAGDGGDQLSVWTWHGWGFQEEWRTAVPRSRSVGVVQRDATRTLVTL